MILFPAIDVKDGQCVRLYQGDYNTAERVAESYLDTARSFADEGAKWLHMVDLDGAKTAVPVNRDIFLEVAEKLPLKVQLGGGIRSMEVITDYLEHGIARVILGSAAIKSPELVREAVSRYGERIAVGIDAKDGMASAEGWLDTSTIHYIELAKRMVDIGVQTIIFTDIAKDGAMQGPNLEQLAALAEAVPIQIIASGGVRDLDDIRALRKLKLYGAICGKSLYKGTLALRPAIAVAQ